MVLSSTTPAPDYALKLVCCLCVSDSSCASRKCGCVTANLARTAFCHCQGCLVCKNEQTNAVEKADDSDNDDVDVS